MNNLVSRNPVLRFKEGRKIVKAADGLKANEFGTELAYFLGDSGKVFKGNIGSNGKRLTQRYTFKGKQYGSFDGGKTYYSIDSGKPLNSRSNLILLNAINRRNTPKSVVKTGDKGNGTRTKTGKVSTKTPINWDAEFTNNFTNTLTNAQRLYLDSKGINYGNAADVLKFLMSLLQTNLGGYKNDGKWGKNSILAWKDFAANNIPENFDLLRNQETMTIGNKPYVEQPTIPAPTLGYRTSNTYEGNDFYDRLKTMGIGSNADLIDFMHRTNGENYNWNGDDWAKQFRSDVNQALGGDYSDLNIRKIFNTSGNWGRGFLGRGDIGDFQNVLQTRAGTWNGEYDRNLNNYIKNDLGDYVKNIDWTKFKLFKQGGQLISKDPIKRFKQRNFR